MRTGSGVRRLVGVVAASAALVDGHAATRAPLALAQPVGNCRVVELEMTPSDDLQIVAWIEDLAGNFVDTAFITRTTGSYGLGNRPGTMQLNSGPWWPYGRRTTTFPVWAGRHGQSWPMVVFQNDDEIDLSHPLGESSRERIYCRPIKPDEALWDANSCASTVYTDKGKLSEDLTSPYPPRSDLVFDIQKDHETIEEMGFLNPFDTVSHATPPGDEHFVYTWAVPSEVPNGEYVLWMEVSREFDQNASYDYPTVENPWPAYGVPYRGQPSVLYRVNFNLSMDRTVAASLDYVGYGDPDGLDAVLRAPDGTITSDVPGSGASRLLLTSDGGEMYRVRVSAYGSQDRDRPDAPGAVEVVEVAATSAVARFLAPGDDGLLGTVSGYEVRFAAGTELTEESFATATPAEFELEAVAGGEEQELIVTDLLPRSRYQIGLRAYDECGNVGPIEVFSVTTPRVTPGAVDACFVATAAYGSLMASEVGALRGFRDLALRTHVAGELAVEGYYTFGPLLARVIAPSETLRQAARAALSPVVAELHRAGF